MVRSRVFAIPLAGLIVLVGCSQRSGRNATPESNDQPPAQTATRGPRIPQEPLEPKWQELVDAYRLLQLPLPPRSARPVKYSSHWGDYEAVGFRLDSSDDPRKALILAGTKIYQPLPPSSKHLPEGFQISEIPQGPLKTEWQLSPDAASRPLELNSAIATAVQCKLRGYDQLADRMLSLAQTESGCDTDFGDKGNADRKPLSILRQLAWGHWVEELRDNAELDSVLSRLKSVRTQMGDGASKLQDRLIGGLELNLKTTSAKPQSVEARIDALVNMTEISTLTEVPREPEPYYEDLVALGFEAVPALIQHADDRRLTRIIMGRQHNRMPHVIRVGSIVSELLVALSDYELGTEYTSEGRFVPQEKARAWWAKMQQTNESDYLVQIAFDAKRRSSLNYEIAYVLSQKYPQQLATVYRRVLDRRDKDLAANASGWPFPTTTWETVNFIMKSKLSRAARFEILRPFQVEDRHAREAIQSRR